MRGGAQRPDLIKVLIGSWSSIDCGVWEDIEFKRGIGHEAWTSTGLIYAPDLITIFLPGGCTSAPFRPWDGPTQI